MLDFDKLTHIDAELLRQDAWKRAMEGQHAAASTGIPSSFLEGLPPELRNFLQSNEFDGGLFTASQPQKSNNHLQVLGLPQDKMPAAAELKKQYRKLAMQYHPDRNQGNEQAAEHFKRVNGAYEAVTGIHERVMQEVEATEAKIKQHFSAHGQNGGWKDTISGGRPATSFPVDHLPEAQKEALIKTLRTEGYRIEEHFSNDIGCNVVSVTKNAQERVSGSEIVQKLRAKFKPGDSIPHVGAAENKAAEALEKAAKSGEEAAAKSGGKAKWIIGGIVAATVAIGAIIAYKKKSAAERERERQSTAAASPSIG